MTASTAAAPRLTPALAPPLRALTNDHALLRTLVGGFGSPLNVVLPQQLSANAEPLHAALEHHPGLRHRIFLAHKPNRSGAVIRAAAVAGLDLDVASEGELRSGLINGFPGSRIEATGPKNPAFIRLALQHGVLMNVDNAAELHQIAGIHRQLGATHPVAVVLRLSGFRHHGRPLSTLDTKFGIPVGAAPEVLRWLRERTSIFRFRGFAFHFTFSTGRERAQAAETLIGLHIQALQLGLDPGVLNIGGGFKVNFLADTGEWNTYVSALKAGLLAQGPPISWNGTGFGMHAESGRITGASSLASFSRTDLADAELSTFLASPLPEHGGRTIGTFLAENQIELHLEPGRALYDQLGLTAARVNFTKQTVNGEWLAGLDMNRSNLAVTDREFFVDPVIIHQRPGPAAPAGVYFGGNLCLPGDLIYRHKTFVDRLPEAGDIVVFPNTAGYFMDFTESHTLLQRIAEKVAVTVHNGQLYWQRDEDYSPLAESGAT